MTIDEIYKKQEISVRSFNVCRYNEFKYVSDLKKYYSKNGSFKKLRNCGRKSNEELIDICNKYQEEYLENVLNERNEENPLKNTILELTRTQRDVINSFILINTNSLSVRSENAISMYLENNYKVKNFAKKLLLPKKIDINKIKNVGVKCVPEIEIYISTIEDFIFEISKEKDINYIIALKNKFLIQRTFKIPFIPHKILESESIFQITEFLLNQNAFFDRNRTLIIKKALKLYNNENEQTLDEIAEQVDLSRERVRQIRKHCLDNLFNKLLFISNFNDDLFQKYNVDIESMYIEINTDILNKINRTNNTNFSREFATYILSVYLKDSFTIVGDYEDVLQPKYIKTSNRHNWNNFYLVEKKLASQIDFDSLANDISNRINDKIQETYTFNFKSFLSKFLLNDNTDILHLLLPICEKIINQEFDIYVDLDENLNFKRNTNRQAYEYSYEALEILGKPSKVKEVLHKVVELHPNYNTDEEKIRSSMKRRYGFVPIGRKSVFGLKKWEKEFESFKGGTIRQIVENYLNKFNEPKPYDDISNYVIKFRPKTNLKSIIYNLKLEESGIFSFYQNCRIGLSYKKYDDKYLRAPKLNKIERKTWEERFYILESFATKMQRLPLSNHVSEKEIKLYRWLNVQKSKQKKGELNKTRENKLISLLAKYPSNKVRRRLNSKEKYKDLISFISKNHRLPSANKKGEEYLYRFFYKQRKLFSENKLGKNEEKYFAEFTSFLQKIKK